MSFLQLSWSALNCKMGELGDFEEYHDEGLSIGRGIIPWRPAASKVQEEIQKEEKEEATISVQTSQECAAGY